MMCIICGPTKAEVIFGGYSLCLLHLKRVHMSDWLALGVDVVIKGILDSWLEAQFKTAQKRKS